MHIGVDPPTVGNRECQHEEDDEVSRAQEQESPLEYYGFYLTSLIDQLTHAHDLLDGDGDVDLLEAKQEGRHADEEEIQAVEEPGTPGTLVEEEEGDLGHASSHELTLGYPRSVIWVPVPIVIQFLFVPI